MKKMSRDDNNARKTPSDVEDMFEEVKLCWENLGNIE
jgi:hypothetical protein